MKKIAVLSVFAVIGVLQSCSNDDDNNAGEDLVNEVVAPDTYEFTRNGNSTVSFSGQTTRIAMGEELISALKDPTQTDAALQAMYAHEAGVNNFSDADLNASNKSIRSKAAASRDYFSANVTDGNAIKQQFSDWITAQVDEVFPKWNDEARAGVAGNIQELGGGSVRYVNAKGLEYNQAVNKGLIGALMVDQALNNYLSVSVLDEANNIEDNNAGKVVEGKAYTNMEHKWDEAYGYAYGLNANAALPNEDLGADSFLNKYIKRVEGDPDFAGIADAIFQAFKLGRAAIVAQNYEVRDAQAAFLREKLSEVVAIRAVYYLQQAKLAFANNDNAAAFHDLSEGFGFIYSLQFTRQSDVEAPYFTKAEVDAFIATLLEGDGFWDITDETLDTMSETIAAEFDFTVAQAASTN